MIVKKFILGLVLIAALPACLVRQSSRSYDCARAEYENVLYKYERELSIFKKMNSSAGETKLRYDRELKDEVLLKNEEFNEEKRGWFKRNQYENYPFMQYRQELDRNITQLEKSKQRMYWKQEGLANSVQGLINKLDKLRKFVVLHKEYGGERKMIERKKVLEVEKKGTRKQNKVKKVKK